MSEELAAKRKQPLVRSACRSRLPLPFLTAFETGQNPAVYLRNLRSYDGTAGLLTKAAASGNFASRPAVWTIASGKPALLNQ
jgi:hypothetical protein